MGNRFAFLSTVFAILLISGCSNKADLETVAAEQSAKEAQVKADKLARMKVESDKLAKIQAEADKLAKVESDKLALEQENVNKEKLAQEELEMEALKLEAEREADVEHLSNTIEEIQQIKIETGSTELSDTTTASLETIISFLKKYPESSITVNSYTDAQGSENKNLELSQARADNIKEYIVSQGISEDRIDSIGFGETSLLDSADPYNIANRRVEIELDSH